MTAQQPSDPSQPLTLHLVYVNMELHKKEEARVAYRVMPFTTTQGQYHEALGQPNAHEHFNFGEAEALGTLYEGEHPKWLTYAFSDEGRAPIGDTLHIVRAYLPSPGSLPEQALGQWIVANHETTIAARRAKNQPINNVTFKTFLISNSDLPTRLKRAVARFDLVVDVESVSTWNAEDIIFHQVDTSASLTLRDAQHIANAFVNFKRRTERENEALEYSQTALEREILTAWEHRHTEFDPQ